VFNGDQLQLDNKNDLSQNSNFAEYLRMLCYPSIRPAIITLYFMVKKNLNFSLLFASSIKNE